MSRQAWLNALLLAAILWLLIWLLVACTITPLPLLTPKQERAEVDAAVFDETAPLAVSALDDVDVRRGVLDVARLRAADINVYQPTFRILEDHRGRFRLIMQDPLTHRYKVVQ